MNTYVHSGASAQSWCFVKQFWNVPLAIGRIQQLLCSPIGIWNFPKKTKKTTTLIGRPRVYFFGKSYSWVPLPTFPLPRFWLTAACRQRPSLRRSGTSCSCGGTRATRQPPAARCRRSPPPQSAAPSSSRRTCPEIIKVESDTDLVIYTTAHIFRFHTGTVSSSPKICPPKIHLI